MLFAVSVSFDLSSLALVKRLFFYSLIGLICMGNFITQFCLLDIFYHHNYSTIKDVLRHACVLLVESGSFVEDCFYLINEPLVPSLLHLYQIFIFIPCSGEKGVSPNTGKSLHYKGSFFHQIIKGSIVQVGCFIFICIDCYMVVLLLYMQSLYVFII